MKIHRTRNLILVFLSTLTVSVCSAQGYFQGTITYTAKATGEPEAAKLFNDSQSNELIVSWSDEGFEQSESRGWNEGKVVYWKKSNKAIYCNAPEMKKVAAHIEDLSKTDPKVKAFMPQLFTYELAPLNEFETIAGFASQKFEVVRSGFIKSGAKAYVWVAKDLKISPSQYKFETDWRQILAVLPLQFGFTEGAILRAQISEPSFTGTGTVDVTYEVKTVQPGYLPKDFLIIPVGYTE